MKKKRILTSWIGYADLRAMALSLPVSKRTKLLKRFSIPEGPVDESGPIKTLLHNDQFDEIHLLRNYKTAINDLFSNWLGQEVHIHQVDLSNPTDYPAVFSVVNETLGSMLRNRRSKAIELCIHLSPGTPAMAAIWVLLGKSRYPATFYQTYQGKSWQTEVPFDLVVDFVPEVLREPDRHLQHLASLSPQEIEGFEHIVGDSKAIRIVAGRARRAAMRDVPVLILGESGTGKELFARAIHAATHRREKPFIALNCAAIPRELLESELFGHKKGAFTGATADRLGALEAADGGTLFLDEVGECDLAIQAKLLRVIEPPPGQGPCYRVFRRLGENKERYSDVRIIAASNQDLQKAINDQVFREDLYYRLAVIIIKIPPLRQRKEDIPLIAQALLCQINNQFRKQEPGFKHKNISAATKKLIQTLSWPGNVRQLYNVLLQAAVMAEGEVIDKTDISQAIDEIPSGTKTDVYWFSVNWTNPLYG